jgi:hypothetical protein
LATKSRTGLLYGITAEVPNPLANDYLGSRRIDTDGAGAVMMRSRSGVLGTNDDGGIAVRSDTKKVINWIKKM